MENDDFLTADELDSEIDPEELFLVEENNTFSTSDAITDLKTGIYNLFVSLFHQHVPLYGPEGAIRASTDFLEEIIVNFRQALKDDSPNTNLNI